MTQPPPLPLPSSNQDILRFSSPSLKEKWRGDDTVVEMLESTFVKFLDAYKQFRAGEGGDNFPDHFHCRYLEIYEQDDNCGTHLFQLKVRPLLYPPWRILTFTGVCSSLHPGVHISSVLIPTQDPASDGHPGHFTKERSLQVQLQRQKAGRY